VNWVPNRRTGALTGAGGVLVLALIDSLLLWRVVEGQVNGWTFICAVLVLASLPAMILIGYWVYGLMRLGYEFDRNRLIIATASGRQIIPMGSVTRVIDGRTAGFGVEMKSPTWPGYWIGSGTISGVGLTLFYATTPPQQQAIVVTPSLAYGISTPDMDMFMEVFDAALRMGPSAEVAQQSEKAGYVHWAIWQDRALQGLLLANLAMSAILFGILLFRYPGLPSRLPLHFDAIGTVDRIASKRDVFALPIIALIVSSINGLIGAVLYRHQRMASYLAWGGGVVVQIFFLLALWNISS